MISAPFGWKIDERGWIETGGVRGGLHRDDPETGIVLYLDVPGIQAAVRRVPELGGTADDLEEPDPSRWYTSCRDDQGVSFGLREPPA